MSNPLVVQPDAEPTGFMNAGTGDNGWATGISIAESAMDAFNGIKDGNWVEAGLGMVGLAADAASMAIDPFGTLLSSAASFLMEHMQPLKEALDWLAGDPPVIESYSATWTKVSGELGKVAEDYKNAVSQGTAAWHGKAGDAYRAAAGAQTDALAGAASTAGSVGTVVGIMGMVVGFVREMVRDLIADLVAKLITWVLEAVFTLGFGTPVIVAQAVTAISKWAAKIAELIQKLTSTIKKVSPMLGRLVEIFTSIMKVVGKLVGKVTGLDAISTKNIKPGGLFQRTGSADIDMPSGATHTSGSPTSTSTDAPSAPSSPSSPSPDGPGSNSPSSPASPPPGAPTTPSPGSPPSNTPGTGSPSGAPSNSTPGAGSPSSNGPSPSSPSPGSPSSGAPSAGSPSSGAPSAGGPSPSSHGPGSQPDAPAAPRNTGQTHQSTAAAPEAPTRPDAPAAGPRDTTPSSAPTAAGPTAAPAAGGSPAGGSPNAGGGAPRPGSTGGWTGTPGSRGDMGSGMPSQRTPDTTPSAARPQTSAPSQPSFGPSSSPSTGTPHTGAPSAGTPHAGGPSAGTPHGGSPSAGGPQGPGGRPDAPGVRSDGPMRPQSATTPTHADAPTTHSGPSSTPHGGPNTPHTQQPGFGPTAPHTGTPHAGGPSPSTPHSPSAQSPGTRPDGPGSRPDSARPDASRPRTDAPGGHPGGPSRPDAPSSRPDGARPRGDSPSHAPDRPSHAPDRPGHSPDRPGHGPDRPGHGPDRPGHGPDTNRPDTNRPDTNRPDSSRPDGTRPDSTRPDGNRPDANRPDPNRPDSNTPDANRPDGNNPDGGPHRDPDAHGNDRPDSDRPDSDRPDSDSPNQHSEPRPDPAEAHARHGETTPAGVSHHGGDPDMGDLPHRVPNDPRFFTADVHITPDGRARVGNHTYSPAEYADMLRRAGYDGSKPVRLIGCDAGSNDFAKQLSKHLDAPVVAPTKPAWTDSRGRVFTSDPEIGPDGSRQPKIPPNGEWETHHPDGSKTKASDDGYAPGSDKDTDGVDARDRAADDSSDYDPDPETEEFRPGDSEFDRKFVEYDRPDDAKFRRDPNPPDDPGSPVEVDADKRRRVYDPPGPPRAPEDVPTVPKPLEDFKRPDGTLPPNTRFDIENPNGTKSSVFTNDKGEVKWVEATSGSKDGKVPGQHGFNPELDYPLMGDVKYRVDDQWDFHTNETGQTDSMSGTPSYKSSDDNLRDDGSKYSAQGRAGGEGKAAYAGTDQSHVKWAGGHLAANEAGGPGEYINMFGQMNASNSGHDKDGWTNAASWRRQEEQLALFDSQPNQKIEQYQVEMTRNKDGIPEEVTMRWREVVYNDDGTVADVVVKQRVFPNVPGKVNFGENVPYN